jgi:hypothetical protein
MDFISAFVAHGNCSLKAKGRLRRLAGVVKIHYLISARKVGAWSALWHGSSDAMKLHAVDIAITATLAVTTRIIRFNWNDKLERAA